MRKAGVISLILLAAVSSPAVASTPVELWKGGDDGLTNRVYDAVEAAFKNSSDFSLAAAGKGELKIEINQLRARDGIVVAPYATSRAGGQPSIGKATCTETTLLVCADTIVSATRKYQKKR